MDLILPDIELQLAAETASWAFWGILSFLVEPVEVREKPIRQKKIMRNPGRELLTEAGITGELVAGKVGTRSLNLFQRLRGHGLLVPSMKKAAP